MLEEPQRRMLFRRELDKKLNDGKGERHVGYCSSHGPRSFFPPAVYCSIRSWPIAENPPLHTTRCCFLPSCQTVCLTAAADYTKALLIFGPAAQRVAACWATSASAVSDPSCVSISSCSCPTCFLFCS
jgi:hypothetical protein